MRGKYIGKTENDEYVSQEVEKGLIRGFNQYIVTETVHGQMVLNNVAWTHSVKLDNGKTLKSGQRAVRARRVPAEIKDLYVADLGFCDECGAAHELDDYDATFRYLPECGIVCKDCVSAADLVTPFKSPQDLFKAANVVGMDQSGLEEVETLFCDSSGWGNDREPALTQQGAERAAAKILQREKGPLYAGLTGIGQFQVYVTIFRKAPKNAAQSA